MDVTSLGFRTDLMVRRLAGSIVDDRGDWLAVRTPENPTFWWGNFLLFQAPVAKGEIDRWTQRFTTEFPDAVHRAFGIDGTSGESVSEEELSSLGVEADISTVLTADGLTQPPEVEAMCRRLAGDEDWWQALRLRQEVYQQPDAPAGEFLLRQIQEMRKLVEGAHGAAFGAFIEGRLVSALAIVSDGSGLARYQNVETHPDYRRRGFARRLLYEAGRYAAEVHSARRLVIVADPDYHAIALYRSLGFADAERQVQLEGPAPVAGLPAGGAAESVA